MTLLRVLIFNLSQLNCKINLIYLNPYTIICLFVCLYVYSFYDLDINPHYIGGDVKVYFLTKPNLLHKLGSLYILEFTLPLPIMSY